MDAGWGTAAGPHEVWTQLKYGAIFQVHILQSNSFLQSWVVS